MDTKRCWVYILFMWEDKTFPFQGKDLPVIEPGEAKVVNFEPIQRGKVLKVYEGWTPAEVEKYSEVTRTSGLLVDGREFHGRRLRIIVPDRQIMTPPGPGTISQLIPGKQAWEDRSAPWQDFLSEISTELQQKLNNPYIVIITKNAKLPRREIAVTDIAVNVKQLVHWR